MPQFRLSKCGALGGNHQWGRVTDRIEAPLAGDGGFSRFIPGMAYAQCRFCGDTRPTCSICGGVDHPEGDHHSLMFDNAGYSIGYTDPPDLKDPNQQPPTQGSTVTTRAQKKATLATRIQALQAELARVESEPEDEYPEHTLIRFDRFINGAGPYTYAAIKVSGRWYRTGTSAGGPSTISWDTILEWAVPGSLKYILPTSSAWGVVD